MLNINLKFAVFVLLYCICKIELQSLALGLHLIMKMVLACRDSWILEMMSLDGGGQMLILRELIKLLKTSRLAA